MEAEQTEMKGHVIYAEPSDFYKRLFGLLDEKSLKPEDFERDGVCSKRVFDYYKYYNGMPGAQLLQRICAYLGVSADYLLGLSNVKDIPPQWIFFEGDCICSKCGARGETTFLYCPTCGRAMDVK